MKRLDLHLPTSATPTPPGAASARSPIPAAAAAAFLVALALAPDRAAAAPPSPGPTPAAINEARERFARGVQLFHENSLEAALAEFQKAYQLAPSYKLHYNIAQVHYELHDFVEALRSFWKYLAQGGNEIPTDRRAQVEAEIRKLDRRVAYLSIATNLDGAQIAVDGVAMGLAPFSAPVLVNPGARRVTANKAGYLPATTSVTAAGGERLKVWLQLNEGTLLTPRPSPFQDPPPAGGLLGSRPRTWISLGATGVLVVSASAFAFATRDAEDDFELELTRVPNSRESIDGARRRMTRMAAVTDVLAGAALVASAATVYFAFTESGPRLGRETARGSGASGGPRRRTPVLSLGPAGFRLEGQF